MGDPAAILLARETLTAASLAQVTGMNVKAAFSNARAHLEQLHPGDARQKPRLEAFVFDDHLQIWSLTLSFDNPSADGEREQRLVRVSEADRKRRIGNLKHRV